MDCPVCKTKFKSARYEGVRIETCLTCGGEWLDHQELKQIVDIREARFSQKERDAVLSAKPIRGVPVKDQQRKLACPQCKINLSPFNYGGNAGVIIDKCSQCLGIWLDADELEKIQILVENWRDGLDADLKQYGEKLRKVSANLADKHQFANSQIRFVNTLINRIVDVD